MKTFFLLSLLYQGTGTAVFPGRNTYPCTNVMMNFEITKEKFKLRDGGYDCSPLVATYDYFTLDIKDGKLLDHGTEVGTISEKEITLRKLDPVDDSEFYLSLRFTEEGLTYKETWKESGNEALVITATLQKESI